MATSSTALSITNVDPTSLLASSSLFNSSRDALNVNKNIATLGSFWNRQMCLKGRKQAKAISNIGLRTYALTKLQNAINNYKNENELLFVTNEVIDLSQVKISKQTVSIETNVKIADQNENVTVSDGSPTGVIEVKIYSGESSSQITTVYPFSKGVQITKIYTYPSDDIYDSSKLTLLPNIDFWQTNQSIIFKSNVDVDKLFSNGYISYDGIILSNSKAGQSLYKGMMSAIDNMPCGEKAQLIANYVNGYNQSLKDFELMLNAIVDAPILLESNAAKLTYIGDQNGQLSDSDITNPLYVDMSQNAYYCFEDTISKKHFVIKSNCPKNFSDFSLNVGDTVPKGWVIDYPIKCFYKESIDSLLPNDAKTYAKQFINPLVISIAKETLKRIWIVNAAQSKDYFYNKYPTVDTLIQRLKLSIKQYAPIGCIPILRIVEGTQHLIEGVPGTITF